MEMTSAEQKKHLTDIFKVLSHEMPLQEEYFCLLMLPLLLYMPGDGAALTVASFDKPSHNPVLIGFVCLTSKWLVAYMLFYLLFYAEGLSSDPQSFNGMFLPSMFRWMTAGGPGSTAFPVMWYVVTRMWPQAWFLGLISFVAIFAQRLSSCWCLMMVQWSVLQDMRWLTVPPKVHECLSDPRGLLLSLPRAAESRDRDMSVPRRDAEPYPTNAVLGPLRNDAVPQENPSGLSQKPGSTQKKPLEGCHVRQRRSSSKDEKISGSANGRGALSRLVWSLNRLLRRSAGDTYEDVDPQDMFDAKQEAMTNAPLSWWGGPDAEDPEKHRRGEAGKKGYRLKKFLLACIVYGPPATVSALLVCCSLPADTAENPRFTAPLHFHMMRHTDMFLRLLLGSVTCIHLAWLFGFREQAQRVGILPLLVLGLSSVSMMLVPLVRVLFSVDLSVSLVMLLWLPWAFIGLTVLIVSVQTAHNLRDILEQHRGPPAKRNRRPPGTRVPRKGLHRSGARSLSLRARTMPFLARDGGSSCNSREDQHFVHSKIWSLERPGSLLCMGEESLPPKVTHSRLLQPQRKGFKHGHPRQQIRRAAWVQARVREMFAVISLFVRLLRSNLYWAFIGNVEILRADLNMALSGNPCRPVPMLWGWLFKFVATPWLLVELVEHCVGTFPKALQQAEGFSVATAYILFGWTIVIVSIIVFGALFPDALEPLLPSRTLEFPRCWVPRISWQWPLPLLEDINPRLFGGSRRGGARQKGNDRRGAGKR
ncbi:hypothetical protein, conserved [Eimeria tenella]|uniref:Transmembrane protein n=1 Tax=Eimeria tenella TaxID=5802 RepID=U6KXH2_EIMTE|nr:hypothetical protein, conserved [Eimeria tenella]CDJ42857.1 hypothetical protein, conserved [Eimeria tenella]|eukprot:XP_013233607.1 hypothetical protein, conserved [Eimeria tenella]